MKTEISPAEATLRNKLAVLVNEMNDALDRRDRAHAELSAAEAQYNKLWYEVERVHEDIEFIQKINV